MITKDKERNLLRITDEITYEGDGVKSDFREKMLLNNHIEGLLQLRISVIDHEKVYEYNTEGLGTLEALTERENVPGGRLNMILKKIAETVLKGERYMLDETDFILDPRYIYINKNDHPVIAYYPGYRHSFSEQITALSEYLMNRVDYHDRESVLTIYTIYMKSREEGFGVKELIAFLEGDTERERKNQKNISPADNHRQGSDKIIYVNRPGKEPVISPRALFDDRPAAVFSKEEKRTNKDKVTGSSKLSICIIAAAGFFVIVTALAVKFKLLLGKDQKPDMIRIACLLLIGAAGGLYIFKYLYGKDKKNNKKTVMPVVEEATELLYDVNSIARSEEYRLVSDSDPEIRITHFPFFIGKDEKNNDFCLNITGVSRRHLKLEKVSGEIYISDMSSTNGSFLNGERLEPDKPVPILKGDEIVMGRCRYRFETLNG
jgi:hypothetical protein